MRRRAFTLIEVLIVIAIIAALAAIIFPVFARAKEAAKKTACLTNLNQIGKSITLYMGDSDDVFPHAIDASDKFTPHIWEGFPEWQARIPYMPMMHEVLQPYIKSPAIFKCASDMGTYILDNHYPDEFRSSPTAFASFGSSYFFRTEIAFRAFTSSSFRLPANVNVMFDAAGHWHGSAPATKPTDSFEQYLQNRREYRYNTLYGDMHTKSLTTAQLQEAWDTEL